MNILSESKICGKNKMQDGRTEAKKKKVLAIYLSIQKCRVSHPMLNQNS